MGKVAYGLQSVEVAEIDGVTGLGDTFENIGDIYRDSITFETSDGEVTRHFAELKQNPIIDIREQGEETLTLRLMDTAASNIVKYAGGTVTGVDPDPEVWNKPSEIVSIEKAYRLTFKDGTVMTINRGKTMAKLALDPNRKGIQLLELMISPLEPKVQDVPVLTLADPA